MSPFAELRVALEQQRDLIAARLGAVVQVEAALAHLHRVFAVDAAQSAQEPQAGSPPAPSELVAQWLDGLLNATPEGVCGADMRQGHPMA